MRKNHRQIALRIIADIILLCAVFLLHWWMSVALAIILAFYFDYYYELLLAGLMLDLLHHAALPRYGDFQFIISLVCAVCFFIITPLRERLRLSA